MRDRLLAIKHPVPQQEIHPWPIDVLHLSERSALGRQASYALIRYQPLADRRPV